MKDATRAAALDHAKAAYPHEACGLVVIVRGKERFWPCRNLSEVPQDQFIIDPVDYAAAEAAGEIVAVFHSHVHIPPAPSQPDLVSCEATGLRWYIVNPQTEEWAEFEPSGYVAPLVGRTHCWGRLDCWSLVRDWYQRERGIDLIDLPRSAGFWRRGENILGDNCERAGFRDLVEGEGMQAGDVILTQTGDSPFPNHVLLYLGDDLILHHAENRLSSRDIYGGWYRKHTVRVVRYAHSQA